MRNLANLSTDGSPGKDLVAQMLECWHNILVNMLVESHRLVSTLKAKGFSEQQAEGVVDAITEIMVDSFATKQDLDLRLAKLEIRFLVLLIPLLVAQVGIFAAIVAWVT